ncbi:MAG: sugar phosphate isomerase/epimerase [Planctomycetales bacterium]|nr:sugar phosphate isomerase/epimerase [Planctomycetales bacterium]
MNRRELLASTTMTGLLSVFGCRAPSAQNQSSAPQPKHGGSPIGICSWSLQNDFEQINALMKTLAFRHIHLDLRPACKEGGDAYISNVRQRDWTISAAMIGFPQEDYSTLESIRRTGGIVPDDCWPQNRDLFLAAIDRTAQLGVGLLSAHIGFIDPAKPGDYARLLDRVRFLADAADRKNVALLMETGQETAAELRQFLIDLGHPRVGLNFDPANMILYGKGDPIEAVRLLAAWIRHVHIKDAIASQTPNQWGAEVVWGTGQVGADRFLAALKDICYAGAVAVEREAGQTRADDIRSAIRHLTAFYG